MANVLLADDHPLFIEALRHAVEGAGMVVTGTASNGDELLDLFAQNPDVDAVLLDLSMPGRDGFECLERLRELRPDLTAIVVSASDDPADIQRAVDLGAVCFVGKAADPADVAGALRVILLDSIHLAPANVRVAPNAESQSLLTPRELEILGLAAEGKSNAEIARSLWVTEQTVKFHLSNLYRKIGVANRTGASRWAQRHGVA